MFLPDWFCSLFDIHCSGVRCVPLIGGISYKDEEGSRTPAITLWSFFFSFKSVLVLLELVVKREGSSDGDGAGRRRQQRSAPGTRLPGDPRGKPAARSWKLLPAAAACPPGSVVSAPWAPGGALRAGTSRGCPGRGRPRAAPGGSAAPGAAPGPVPEGLRGFGPGWAQEPLPLDRPESHSKQLGVAAKRLTPPGFSKRCASRF